jgi:hypothetical protein
MKFIIAAMTLATSSLAFAYHCPNEMKAIDAKLATNPTLSAADMGKVKELRAQGEKLHKEGKHDDSLKALDSAKKLLGI